MACDGIRSCHRMPSAHLKVRTRSTLYNGARKRWIDRVCPRTYDKSVKNYGQILFKKYFLSFALVLIISVIAGSIIQLLALRILDDYINDLNRDSLEKTRLTIEKRLQQLDTTLFKINSDVAIRKMLHTHRPLAGPVIYHIREAWRETRDYFLDEDSMLIYFGKPEIVFSSEAIHTDLARFYDEFFTFSNLDLPQFKREILETSHYKDIRPISDVSFDGKSTKASCIFNSLPLDIPGSTTVLVMSFIEGTEIAAMLRTPYTMGGGWSYVVDAEGLLLASEPTNIGSDKFIKGIALPGDGSIEVEQIGVDFTVTSLISSLNGWTYVAAVASRTLMNDIHYIRRITLLVVLSLLLIGLPVGIYLAYRYSIPVRLLVRTNFALGNTLKKQNIELEKAYLRRLLLGRIDTLEKYEESRSHLELPDGESEYLVLILFIKGYAFGNCTILSIAASTSDKSS